MVMSGVPRRFAFFEVEFGVVGSGRRVVTAGENRSSGETTNPHFVRGISNHHENHHETVQKAENLGIPDSSEKISIAGGRFLMHGMYGKYFLSFPQKKNLTREN